MPRKTRFVPGGYRLSTTIGSNQLARRKGLAKTQMRHSQFCSVATPGSSGSIGSTPTAVSALLRRRPATNRHCKPTAPCARRGGRVNYMKMCDLISDYTDAIRKGFAIFLRTMPASLHRWAATKKHRLPLQAGQFGEHEAYTAGPGGYRENEPYGIAGSAWHLREITRPFA